MECFKESHFLTMECKVGGKVHPKLNVGLRSIANKYHEGNVKRTLKRKLEVHELADVKANEIVRWIWVAVCCISALLVLCACTCNCEVCT